MRLIGLTGKAGSGKDTVAWFLRAQGFASISFSDPLKEFASEAAAIRAAGGRIWRVEGVTRCLSCRTPVVMPPLCEDCEREGAGRRLTGRELAAAEEAWRSHASETEGAAIEADLLIRNDGTLDDLREKVVAALAVTQAQGAWESWESSDIDHEVKE